MSFSTPTQRPGDPQYDVTMSHPNGARVTLRALSGNPGVTEAQFDTAILAAIDALENAGFTTSYAEKILIFVAAPQ